MRTAKQGTLDGLCGIYAIINSLERVGVQPGRGSLLQQQLFQQLVYGLGAVRLLAAMRDGITATDLVDTSIFAFAWMESAYGIKLQLRQPLRSSRIRAAPRFLQTIDRYLAMPETAVVISYNTPSFAHWTVVQEVGRTQLTLRDSSRGSYLPVAEFTVKASKSHFRVTDTLLIKRLG